MQIVDGLLACGVVACWCLTAPEILKNWRDVRTHRKPDDDWRLKEAGLFRWDYADCTKDQLWCDACQQPAKYGMRSSYDWLVIDSGMLVGATAICIAVVWMT